MERLITIKTQKELEELRDYLSDKDIIAYDTETNGVEKESHVIGFSVCAEPGLAYYVVLSYWDKETHSLLDLETKALAADFLKCLVGKNLIMHNGVFDCWMTDNNFKVSLIDYLHTDTMILAHLVDENRSVGLKELGLSIFGETANQEQLEMKESVTRNGGFLTKDKYELFKADADLLARYGAKDAILTLNLFHHLVPQLFEQGLDAFFYEEESMPLLRGPTYELNTTGLRVDPEKLENLRLTLEAECLDLKAYIYQAITPYVQEKYKGTTKTNTFNIGASQQMAWLLYEKLGNLFHTLTDGGRELCKCLEIPIPYTNAAKRDFIEAVKNSKGQVYQEAKYNPKTKKMGRPKTVKDPWVYMTAGKISLGKLSDRYTWVEKLLEHAKNKKLLNTYVKGIQAKMRYNVIRPSFLQHGTTSGRYSSKNPNFQNLPRKEKRIKACIISRPGKVFVAADQAQLEPRVFASISQDPTLMGCFSSGEDFYSVVGAPIFGKTGLSLVKEDPNSFAVKHPDLRDKSKVIALATPYGRTAAQQASTMGISVDESKQLISNYFHEYPNVENMMLEKHKQVKAEGAVYSIYGRPRRIPEAMSIERIYGKSRHADLPYEARNLLNLAMNHPIQSTGASIMNRSTIAIHKEKQRLAKTDPRWKEVRIVMQVHDEVELEGPEELKEAMRELLKRCMETTCILPGVALLAEPTIAYNLADLK